MTEADGLAFIVGLVGVLISLCALGLTLYHGSAIRKHNRLIVTPWIKLDSEKNSHTGIFEVTVKNSGLGPAKLTSVKYSSGGVEKSVHEFMQFVQGSFTSTNDHFLICEDIGIGDGFLAKDESMIILRLQYEDKKLAKSTEEKFRNEGWNIEVKYESIYGQEDGRILYRKTA